MQGETNLHHQIEKAGALKTIFLLECSDVLDQFIHGGLGYTVVVSANTAVGINQHKVFSMDHVIGTSITVLLGHKIRLASQGVNGFFFHP